MAADCRNVLTEIVHANLGLMLAGDQQQVFEPQRLDGFALACDLRRIERFALDAVAHRKATVGAVVGTQVREVQRHIEADDVAEALTGQLLRTLRQRFQIRRGGGRSAP